MSYSFRAGASGGMHSLSGQHLRMSLLKSPFCAEQTELLPMSRLGLRKVSVRVANFTHTRNREVWSRGAVESGKGTGSV